MHIVQLCTHGSHKGLYPECEKGTMVIRTLSVWFLEQYVLLCGVIDVGTGGTGGTCPQDFAFCNEQRSALLIFRKCPTFHKEKSALKVSCLPSLRCFLLPSAGFYFISTVIRYDHREQDSAIFNWSTLIDIRM